MKKVLSIALTLVMAITITACGSGTSTSTSTTASTSSSSITGTDATTHGGEEISSEPTANGQNLKIVYCGTSLSTDNGKRLEELAKFVEKEVNDAGGVNGQNVEFVVIDGGNDQQSYINALLKALEEENVSAIIGTFFSQYALACADYVNDAQIPVFNIATNFEMREKSEYYFTNRCVDTAFSNVMAQVAIDNGCENPVAVVYNTSNGKNDSQFMKEYLENNGKSMAEIIEFDNTSTTDYTPIVQKAISVEGSDGILLHATANTDGQSIISLLKQYNYEYPIISNSNLFADQFIKNAGAESCIGLLGFSEYPTPEVRPNVQEFSDKVINSDLFSFPDVSWIDASFYDDCYLIIEAAKIEGANDKDAVFAGLSKINGYKGVMTSYTFHDDGSYADYIYLATIVEDTNNPNGASIMVTDPLKVEH